MNFLYMVKYDWREVYSSGTEVLLIGAKSYDDMLEEFERYINNTGLEMGDVNISFTDEITTVKTDEEGVISNVEF